MDLYDLLAVAAVTRAVWKCVCLSDGALCVIVGGEYLMPKWLVDNWDYPEEVSVKI